MSRSSSMFPISRVTRRISLNISSFVFVHGLSGNSLGTWCPAKEKAWFDDWPLPPFEMPVARVLYYNCELPVFSNAGIEIAANHLLFTLAKDCVRERVFNCYRSSVFRSGTDLRQYETRPLIFICHSLGGVVLQKVCALSSSLRVTNCTQALIQAHMRANFIVGCTRGIVSLLLIMIAIFHAQKSCADFPWNSSHGNLARLESNPETSITQVSISLQQDVS